MAPRHALPPIPTLLPPLSPALLSLTKQTSILSPSPSSEADDEGSSDFLTMDSDVESSDGRPPDAPKFHGEDTSLTSQKELTGWYSYGWAAEVFVVCGVGSFIPITLEQLARENGVLLSDKHTPCASSYQSFGPQSLLGAMASSTLSNVISSRSRPSTEQCVIYLLGAEINTASFAMYTFSVSVLVQALLIISMSGAADHGHSRKTFLLITAFLGALSTMLFFCVTPKIYLLGAVLAIVSNSCFGASFVLLNSFLPLLVRHHPTVQYAGIQREYSPRYGSSTSIEDAFSGESERDSLTDEPTDGSALLPRSQSRVNNNSPASAELRLSTRISSYGVGIGYAAAVIVQTLCIFVVMATHSTLFSLRLALFIVGLWWFVFTIPSAITLRPRPGPPLSLPGNFKTSSSLILAYVTYAWTALFHTLLRARHLRDMVAFLLAWFLLSDGIATVSGTAVLFAKTTLSMPPAALAAINIISTLAGVLGAFGSSLLTSTYHIPAVRTLCFCVSILLLVPLYGLLPYIPAIGRMEWLGLQHPLEMYPMAAVYGFALGGISAHARAFFGELIPPGNEAAFYALYAITDKGSSVFGPAIVGAITDRWGSIRPAFVFLGVLIALPLPLMMLVDVDRGKREGEKLVEVLEGDGQVVNEDGDGVRRQSYGTMNGGRF